MASTSKYIFRGPIKALVFDWAGTIIDYGSCAPAAVFIALFDKYGIRISQQEARAPMGLDKYAHIQQLLNMPAVAQRWQQAHGQQAAKQDIDQLYADFIPMAMDILPNYTDLIPGMTRVVEICQSKQIKIGTSTGYTRQLMETILPKVSRQGFTPDAVVCCDDVHAGRPAPWMCYENARRLDVYPTSAMVKIDDTLVGIEAGRHAGMWTVGVTESGNEFGLTPDQIESLSPSDRTQRRERAENRMVEGGAHFAINSVADLPEILTAIELRLAEGHQP